jgi:HEAT repeat protein
MTVEDPYELIRRKSVSIMGDIGKEEYIPLLVKAIFNDPSKRVRFNAQRALSKIEFKKEHIGKYLAQVVEFIPKEKAKVYFDKQPFSRIYWLENEIFPAINKDSLKTRKRLQAIRYFRNFRYHPAVDQLINIAKDITCSSQIRTSVLEALGWFTYSIKRLNIMNACDDIINNEVVEKIVKDEALKTKNRLLNGANNPLTP